jgi:SAM-dependent methyltransferase
MKMAGSNTDTEGNGGHRSPEGWNRREAMIEGFAAPAAERMLSLCGIERGLRALDIAAGTGLPSLLIADRVGKEGAVLATDMSGEMLDVLKKKAEAAGLENVETKIMDGQNLDVPEASFDAIVCQFGLMLFPDADRSLRSMFNALRPAGRAGIIVFTTPDKNPHMSIPASITRKHLGLPAPEPGRPGHFSFGETGLLESKMKDAGFVNVTVEVVTTELVANSAAEFANGMRDAGAGPTPMLAKADDATKEAVWNEIAASLKKFEKSDRCIFSGELLVAVGRRP